LCDILTPVPYIYETPAGNYWKKGQKIITEIMVSELKVLQCNKFHHHLSLAMHWFGQPICKSVAKAWVNNRRRELRHVATDDKKNNYAAPSI
jgi:hypothetical protein